MDDFNNNTPSGNEQQNTPESTGNFQSAPEAGNDAQRANSGSPYNGGYQPNNGYPYSNGGGNTNNGSSNANGSNNGYSSGNNGYYGSNGAYRPSSTYSGNNSYVYYGNSGQPPKKPVDNKPSKHKKGGVIALIIAVVVCVALGVTGIAVSLSNKDGAKKQTSEKASADSSTVTINETPTASSTDKSGSLTAAGVYDKIKDSSVGILVYSDSRSSSASGVQAKPLNGAQRLKLMHDMFNMDGASKFHFDWKDLVKSGLSVKDAIAPTAFAFKNSRTFQMGGIFCAASFLSITASDISDQLLKDFLDMDSSQIVTMHIQSVDQNRAIKTVKRTITELDRSKIEEQKKAIRAGYDIDIIPSDLATYGRDAKALLKELQSQNERMFLVTFLVLNTGRTEQELENNVFQASSIAQKHNCNLCRLDFQQEHGLMSSLPLADCQIEIQRGLTTSSTAIFIPFTTQELYQSGKESLYYGLNALSNNLIMVDRKKLKNPNGLILGTPGSGKSFSAKREIANAFLVTDDDIIINDPEGEYSPLVNRLKGQVIKISPNSTQFVNPMDINANYSEEDNPLSLKADFILSLCELVVGGKEGLLPVEKTVIDRCVHLIYRKYFANPCPENMPILEDLYNALLQQDEKEAHHVATALEIYVKGSLNLFNHRTNVNVNNRIVCYDIKELGKQMKKLGMLIVQDQVWGRVTANRSSGKSTRYYMDEMHLLLKEEQTAAYSVEIWKRFRKWGGIPTGLTQNVKDLLSSREVENIFENSDMIIMLNQAAGDRQILAKQLNISPHQLSYVTHSGEGEGLLFFGNVILPFVDRFPTDLELYRIMTTKLGEVSEGAQK